MSRQLRNKIVDLFKLHGLPLRGDGANLLRELIEPIRAVDQIQWIEKVIEEVQKLPLTENVITKEVISEAVKEVRANEVDDNNSLLHIIDIFTIPKLVYNLERKKFVCSSSRVPELHGSASAQCELFRDRYEMVFQRTSNHELFHPLATGANDENSKRFSLTKVEFLLSTSGKQENIVSIGLLTMLVEGKFYLEDDTGAVPVSLANSKFHTGMFTHNSFVLVEGWYDDGVLHANAIGLPPAELSSTSRALLGNVNYFGGSGNGCAKYIAKLKDMEEEASQAMLVFLSDIWLDKIIVKEKLFALFAGFSQCPPIAFVLCGNFLSEMHGPHQIEELRNGFKELAETIRRFSSLLSDSKFLFVPGPMDPGPAHILPRPPLPECITSEFKQLIPCAEFVTNPCRLLFCTQEIVIFREDIVSKMCRNSIYFPSDSDEISSHFGKTIVSQAHLVPLPMHVLPVYWNMDHCLSLHPTPDVIVIADKSDSFVTVQNKATIFNPGSFPKNNFSFKVYVPATKQVEDSQIGD